MKAFGGVFLVVLLVGVGMRQARRNRELQLNLPIVACPLDRKFAPLAVQFFFDPVR